MPEATTAPVDERTSEREREDTFFECLDFDCAEMGSPAFLPNVTPGPDRHDAR
ncbi:MAG TPA: hypothetical protein VES95_00505 [Dermatophilaceae bacterium]|nr:hypothetical protein [Dermatophilaceae bacterium]